MISVAHSLKSGTQAQIFCTIKLNFFFFDRDGEEVRNEEVRNEELKWRFEKGNKEWDMKNEYAVKKPHRWNSEFR